jgi:hypothetical protein
VGAVKPASDAANSTTIARRRRTVQVAHRANVAGLTTRVAADSAEDADEFGF